MTHFTVKSLAIEVEHPDGSGTIVVRAPLDVDQCAYVAGELSPEVADAVIAALGLSGTRKEAAGTLGDVRSVPSRPGLVHALEAPITSRSLPHSTGSTRRRGPVELADLLEELAQAVLRAGRKHPTSTVDELLESAWLVGGNSAPLARLLARLEASLAPHANAAEAALVLAALGELIERLRDPSDDLTREVGGHATSRPLEPCELLELARRRERGSVGTETRILLDLSTGELMYETPLRPGARLSRGPVGRHLSVTLGRRYSGDHARVEIQHYEYDPAPTAEHLERANSLASSGVTLPAGSGLRLVTSPEPVLLQLQSIDPANERMVCLNGTTLDLDDGSCPGVTAALLELVLHGAHVDALVGTLEIFPRVGEGGALAVVPWAAIVESEGARLLVPLAF
jgi:hypothetical protein